MTCRLDYEKRISPMQTIAKRERMRKRREENIQKMKEIDLTKYLDDGGND